MTKTLQLVAVTIILGIGATLLASNPKNQNPLNKVAVTAANPSKALYDGSRCGTCVGVDPSCNSCHMNCMYGGSSPGYCLSCSEADPNGCNLMGTEGVMSEYTTAKSGRTLRMTSGYKRLPMLRDHESRSQEALMLGCKKFSEKYGKKP